MFQLLSQLILLAVPISVFTNPGHLREENSSSTLPPELVDHVHGVRMGVASKTCDDAETRLELDWDGSPVNYTCFTPKRSNEIRDIPSIATCVNQTDAPTHFCMDTPIEYKDDIPTSGAHRPLWPVFGEYKFVPVQRWIHSLEHGAVVMLYDPCTHPSLVNRLRLLVTSCIRKHVITPYNKLPTERPLALVAWGCKLVMNQVDDREVVRFIREHGMKAPEWNVYGDGQYDKLLVRAARPPFGSNMQDEFLCPFAP